MSRLGQQTGHTNKDIFFLSDPGFCEVLGRRLEEIDVVVGMGLHRASVILTMSAVEGIVEDLFRSLDKTRLDQIKTDGEWPEKDGKPKKRKALSLKERVKILDAAEKIPPLLRSELYERLWDYRNFVHLCAETRSVRDGNAITQAVAQAALAGLNALVEMHSPWRVIQGNRWEVLCGEVQYAKRKNVLRLSPTAPTYPGACLLVTDAMRCRAVTIQLTVVIPPGALFGIVYN